MRAQKIAQIRLADVSTLWNLRSFSLHPQITTANEEEKEFGTQQNTAHHTIAAISYDFNASHQETRRTSCQNLNQTEKEKNEFTNEQKESLNEKQTKEREREKKHPFYLRAFRILLLVYV